MHMYMCVWCVAWSKSASECVENVVPSLCDASCDVCMYWWCESCDARYATILFTVGCGGQEDHHLTQLQGDSTFRGTW